MHSFITRLLVASSIAIVGSTAGNGNSMEERQSPILEHVVRKSDGWLECGVPEVLPIGLSHDFGKLKFGEIATKRLSFANMATIPLRVNSVRVSSANHLQVTASKKKLEPGEELKLDVGVDTRFFVGRKTTQIWLDIEYGGKKAIVLVTIAAESVKN